MLARKKAAAPESREETLPAAFGGHGDQNDKTWQVVIQATQAVVHPSAHARPPGQLAAGLEEGDCRVVVDRLGVHRADDADLVGNASRVRQEITDHRATLAPGLEGELARLNREA